MIIEEDNRIEKKEQEKQYLVDIIKSLNLPKHYYTEFDVYSNLHINKGTNKWYKTIFFGEPYICKIINSKGEIRVFVTSENINLWKEIKPFFKQSDVKFKVIIQDGEDFY